MARTIIVDAALRPSRELGILLGAAHGVAAACPWLAGLPTWSCVAVGMLVLGWGAWQVWTVAGLRRRNAVTRFRLQGDGRMTIERRAAGAAEADCLGIEPLGRLGVVVRFRESGRRITRLVVWRDQGDPRSLRRLLAAARWNAGIASGHELRDPFGECRDLA
jgi:hypothetical protein